MNIIRVTCFALGAFVFAASCSQGAAESDVFDWVAGDIYFKPSLSDVVSSRSQDMTLEHLESFQVTCFNTGDIQKDESGSIIPYFENATFIRQVSSSAGVTYVSSPAEGPREWPKKDGLLRFFAFSPSLEAMAAANPALGDNNRGEFFNLINNSTETNSTAAIDYRLGTVRVNPDISKQFDFVTAEASGERWKDFSNGVDLAFHHQMSQVE
ncbi:MAG: fimbrillin family protein, partial [Muribaculaceae bacterium]|nr:fimbrillin family protein [Muribaculaceae bacterium]